jgi:CheY-specific phosphatase CheX
MEAAADSFEQTCRDFLSLEVQRSGDVGPVVAQEDVMGAIIGLNGVKQSWNLAMIAPRDSCVKMAKALFAMEDDEDPGKEEIADGLGELVNIVVGALKTAILDGSDEDLRLGLPLFVSGNDCFEYVRKGIGLCARRMIGEGVDAQLVLFFPKNE